MIYLYMLLSSLVLVTFYLSYALQESNPYLSGLAGNGCTELVGILITVSVVQALLNRTEKTRRLKLSRGAFLKLARGYNDLLSLFASLIKGVSAKKLKFCNFHDFLDPSVFDEIEMLDIGRPIDPTRSALDPNGRSWGERIASIISAFKRHVQDVLEMYGDNLPDDYLEVLYEVVENPYLEYLESIAVLIIEDKYDTSSRTHFRPSDGKKERDELCRSLGKILIMHAQYSPKSIDFPALNFESFSAPEWHELRVEKSISRPIIWTR